MQAHTNHLIIGLGGTGGKIIRSLRKLIYQNLRQENPTCVNLRYLYIDTDAFLMQPDNPSWKILGRSVQLPERSLMYISGLNLKQIVDNLNNYPNLQPWLGGREEWEDILKNADAANLQGGQKRRLGRFLFAGASADFLRRVGGLVTELQQAESAEVKRSKQVTFHVCCGLAGGTGSGSVCDAVSQIRKVYAGSDYRIIIYALLPERHTPNAKGGPNYHANGYAALMELNSLVIGAWRPHDVAGVGNRLDVQDPFNCCYLFHDENEAGVTVSVDTEIPEIVGSFLYQKVVEMQKINWGSKNTLMDQETFIVGGQAKESEKSPRGKARRSRSFFAFGIKQIAYPEVEIREYLTYSFARQAVLQQLYNNWVEGQGYQEIATNQSFNEFVREKATLQRWSLTDDHLTLSEGILKDEVNNKTWRKIPDFWRMVAVSYVEDLLKTSANKGKDDKLRMLPELEKRCEAAFTEQYRGSGVKRFYETKRGDMRDQVREIRGKIEADLFDQWKNGDQSMYDVSRLLAALVAAIEERIAAMDAKIVKASDESEEFKNNEKTIKDNRVEWSKLNWFSMTTLFDKDDKLLKAQGECYIIRYRMRTQLEGLRYAKDLLAQLRTDLQGLASEVSEAAAMTSKAAKSYQAAIDTRCADEGSEDLSKQVIRFYEPQKIKDFAKSLTLDKTEQKKQTSKVRTQLADLLADKQTFTAFNSRITEGQFLDVVESACDKSALEAHEEFISKHPDRQRILRQSVMELLRKDFDGSPERLRTYAQKVMEHAKNYLKLDPAQVQHVGPGIPVANNPQNAVCVTYVTIIAPEAPEAKEFRESFCRALADSTSAFTTVVTNAGRPQEVTLLSATSVFPARFVGIVDFLRQEYEKRMYGTGKEKTLSARAYLELHSEGDAGKLEDGQELYSLYPESYKPADLYPWLLIANALNVVKVKPHAITKLDTVYLTTLDEDGIENDQELGAASKDGNTLKRVLEKADIAVFETVKDIVEPMLAQDYPSAPQREEVLGKIRLVVQENAKTLGSNHPDFIQLRAAFDKTKGMLTLGG
jgi:hypothetical protein